MHHPRAFHERISTDLSFKTALQSAAPNKRSDMIQAAGFFFSDQEWSKFLQELSTEKSAFLAARQATGDMRWAEAVDIVTAGRQSCPASWLLFEFEAALQSRQHGLDAALEQMLSVSSDDPFLSALALPEQDRVRDVLAFSLGAYAYPLNASDQPHDDGTDVVPDLSSGWSLTGSPVQQHGPCPLDRRHNLAPEEFRDTYAERNRPMILSGLTDDWSAWSAWTRDALLRERGDLEINIRASRAPGDFRRDYIDSSAKQVTLRDFVTKYMPRTNEGWYLFQSIDSWSIDEQIKRPAHFAPPFQTATSLRDAPLFYIGAQGTGLNHHQHLAAWNALIHGYKLWSFLLPLGVHHIQNGPLSQTGVAGKEPELHITFLQKPGDIVFVPQYWSHATYNLTDCVGAACEIGTLPRLFDQMRSSLVKT